MTTTYRFMLRQTVDNCVDEAMGNGPWPAEVDQAVQKLHLSMKHTIDTDPVLAGIFNRRQPIVIGPVEDAA